jgi:hypothetical protein
MKPISMKAHTVKKDLEEFTKADIVHTAKPTIFGAKDKHTCTQLINSIACLPEEEYMRIRRVMIKKRAGNEGLKDEIHREGVLIREPLNA